VWHPGIPEWPYLHCFHTQAHERLEETKLEAVRDNNLELVQEILRDLAELAEQSSTAAELARILQEPHFQVPGCWLLGVGWGGQLPTWNLVWKPALGISTLSFLFLFLFSPSWRHMTQWPQRPMRHHPPVQV